MGWLKPGVRVPPAGPNTPLSTLTCGPQVPGRHRFWTLGARGGLHTKADPDGDVVLVFVRSVRGGRTHRCHRQGAFPPPSTPSPVTDMAEETVGARFPQRRQKCPSTPASSQPHSICRANPVWLDPFCRNLELAAQAEHEDDLPENLSEITDLWNSPTRTHVSLGRRGRGQS